MSNHRLGLNLLKESRQHDIGATVRSTFSAPQRMPVLAYDELSAGEAEAAQVVFLADSLDRLTEFPRAIRQKLGFALYQAQIGQTHESAKILRGFADAIWQVRADDSRGTYRAVYVTQLGEAIYVLHAFQKKSTSGIATPKRELDLIRQRLQLARRLAGKAGD